jgi:hypothetical protein
VIGVVVAPDMMFGIILRILLDVPRKHEHEIRNANVGSFGVNLTTPSNKKNDTN